MLIFQSFLIKHLSNINSLFAKFGEAIMSPDILLRSLTQALIGYLATGLVMARAQPLPPQPILLPLSTAAGCLIESDYGNFETVILQGHDLVHFWHPNDNATTGWVRGQVITSQATGPGCIMQSDFGSDQHKNFEVVVPEGYNLVHYFHNNSNILLPWQRAQTISTHTTGPAAIIQSDYKSGDHGNFEVLALEGTNIVHYYHDNSNVASGWDKAATVSTTATSGASLIQSDFKSGDHHNFEAVVREGPNLAHYYYDGAGWHHGQIISSTPGGPGVIIQSDFKSGDHGNFELLTTEHGALVHYFHDNSDVNKGWQPGQTVTAPASGSLGFIQGSLGSGDHMNFEVVAFHDNQVFHFFHDNSDVNKTWQPGQVVTPITRSQKICQLTGDTDFQNRGSTKNRTGTNSHVLGTDLGYPFEHDGRLYFLFGDTAGIPDGGDVLAFTREADPEACPDLTFPNVKYNPANGLSAQPIAAPGISMKFFEVPTTGFSANGHMYVFVWTDHADTFQTDAQGNEIFSDPVGYTVLLRSDDNGLSFHQVWDHLGDKLVYLSAVIVNNADILGLQKEFGPGSSLLMWGSGKMYRASNPYLAAMPLRSVEDKRTLRYFAGLDNNGQPRWGAEADGQPLFTRIPPCIGELSVTWNRNLRQWLMLYNCGDARVSGNIVVARASDTPWGPWSEEAVLFDPVADAGRCYFIHRDDCGPPTDPVSPAQIPGHLGDVYAPFVLPRFTEGGLRSTTIYYVMSTWNPYDVVLMKSTLMVRSRLPYGPDTCKQGYVWREAIPDDHVCVTPDQRMLARQQNQDAASHRAQGGPYGLDTCKQSYVWREAYADDHVCVTPAARAQARTDNEAASSRFLAN
jgi:Domain of unknown function (DUF4185)